MSEAAIFDWVSPEIAVWAALLVVIVAVFVFKLGPAAELRARAHLIPEGSSGFSEERLRKHLREINRTMETYGRNAHELYSHHLLVDSIFAVIYAVGLGLVAVGIWRQEIEIDLLDSFDTIAVTAPLIMGGCDLVENYFLRRALGTIPPKSLHTRSTAKPPKWSTRGKLVSGSLTLLLLLAGLLGMSPAPVKEIDDVPGNEDATGGTPQPTPLISRIGVDVEYPLSLKSLAGDYAPNPFKIRATVSNLGDTPVTDVEVTINFPPVLSYSDSQSATRSIGLLPTEHAEQITWEIRALCVSEKEKAEFFVTAVGTNVPAAHTTGRVSMPSHPQGKPLLLTHGFEFLSRSKAKRSWSDMTNALRDWGWCGPIETVAFYEKDEDFTVSVDGHGDHLEHFQGGDHRDHSASTDVRHIAYHWAWMVHDLFTMHGESVELVGHSMGGLIIRYALARVHAGDREFPKRLAIENVISLGSPHQGTRSWRARLCRVFLKKQCRQLRPGSDFIEWLRVHAQDPGQLGGVDWTTIGSRDDRVVKPHDSMLAINAMHKVMYLDESAIGHSDYMNKISDDLDAMALHWTRGNDALRINNAPWPARWVYLSLVLPNW